MSVAAPLSPTLPHRPRLMVIHGGGHEPTAAESTATVAQQDELPLAWPLDRRGAAAAGQLASYPPLPLPSGVVRPEPFVANLARLLADVLVGARPISQLSRCASLDLTQKLGRRALLRRQQGKLPGGPTRVSSTSTMVVGPAAAQAVMVFLDGTRAHGAALRLEFRHNRWLLTDVETPA